jgi:hypothetical protein
VPNTTPKSTVKAKPCITCPANKSIASTENTVVREVTIVRENVSFIDLDITKKRECLASRYLFERILSKIITESLTEYPITVSIAAIIEISRLIPARHTKPTVSTASWISVIITLKPSARVNLKAT